MLDRTERPSRSDEFQYGAVPGLREVQARASAAASDARDSVPDGRRTGLLRPRLVVGLALIIAGIAWAFARGLHFYGLSLAELGYDLDQPPLLLAFVGIWLLYRSGLR
jgi:hypothetical protein